MPRIYLAVISVVAGLMLTACGPPGIHNIHRTSDLQKYPDLVRKNTLESYDDFKKQTWITGPRLGSSGDYQFLRALAAADKSIHFIQLYVYDFDWGKHGHDFHSAYDQSGRKLQFIKIRYEKDRTDDTSTVDGHTETTHRYFTVDEAAVTLGYQDLLKHRTNGLNIRLYGKNSDKVYHLPGVYIDDFLKVLEADYNLKRLK